MMEPMDFWQNFDLIKKKRNIFEQKNWKNESIFLLQISEIFSMNSLKNQTKIFGIVLGLLQ